MKRTDAAYHTGNLFQSGNPLSGQRGTRLDHTWLNAVQEEIAQTIEATGSRLDGTRTTQLRDAVTTLSGGLDVRTEGARSGGDAYGNTISLQQAINRVGQSGGGTVRVSGGYYEHNTLMCPYDNVHLELASDAVLAPRMAFEKGIVITGDRCSIGGGGTLHSLAQFNLANERNTYAVIWVEDCRGFRVDDITLDVIPRAGIHFEDAFDVSVERVRARGGVGSGAYDPAVTTGHGFVSYNPGPGNRGGLRVHGCEVEGCIQGVQAGNYDGAAALLGVRITDTLFRDCYDHAVYLQYDRGSRISGNTTLDCNRPIAMTGDDGILTHNVVLDTGTNTRQQTLGMRTSKNCLAQGNIVVGPGAGFDISDVRPGDVYGNRVVDNIIVQTVASAQIPWAVRLQSRSGEVRDNTIAGNRIVSLGSDPSRGAVDLGGGSVGQGRGNRVQGNAVHVRGLIAALVVRRNEQAEIVDNTFEFSSNSPSPYTLTCVNVLETDAAVFRENTIRYVSGGSNVTARGFQTNETARDTLYERNFVSLTAPALAGAAPFFNRPEGTQLIANRLSKSTPMQGIVSVPAGRTQWPVENANVLKQSVVRLTPANAEAAAVTPWVEAVDGRFMLNFRAPTVGAGQSTWRYSIS